MSAADSISASGSDPRLATLLEQRRIRELLASLDRRPAGDSLADRLAELYGLVERNVVREEASDGLYAAIQQAAPRLAHHVEELMDANRTLLHELIEVTDTVRMSAEPDPTLRTRLEALAEHLRAHFRRENQLLFEAMHTDIGSGE